ncbi:MAG: serine/threonine protein kinase [Microthrixaceae bacterium]|nr:serine/threonine protein kinase [Microthrixaceae bacterium]
MSEKSIGLGLGAGLPTDRLLDLQLVSAGGQGLLYRAHDKLLSRPVAVKILTNAPTDGPLPSSVTAQARMSWHPRVMSLYDAGRTTTGLPYLIMEYLEGGSCEQLRRRGPVAVDRVLRIGLELAEALQASHDHHIAHCDVKPSNVLLDSHDHVRLGDFGSARDFDRSTTTLDEIQGSLMYVAPETLEGVRPGKPADVYALALTIRALLTGDAPWAEARSLGDAIATRLQTKRLDFPTLTERPRLRKALEAATDIDPDRRPVLPDLITELRIAAGRQAVPVVPAPPPRHPRIVFAVAALCLLVGSVIGYVIRPAALHEAADEPEGLNPQGAFCSTLIRARVQHARAVLRLEQTVARAGSAEEAVESMIIVYPREFASIYRPVVDVADQLTLKNTVANLSSQALADMALVDGLYRAGIEPRGLVDAKSATVQVHGELRASVAEAAASYSTLLRHGEELCGLSALNSRADNIKAAIDNSVAEFKRFLTEPQMSAFFDLGGAGQRTSRMFDANQIDLILSSGSVLLDQFGSHLDWLVHLLEGDREIRDVVFANYLGQFVKYLSLRMPYTQTLPTVHPDWVSDMQARFRELPEHEQVGINRYVEAVTTLGLGR